MIARRSRRFFVLLSLIAPLWLGCADGGTEPVQEPEEEAEREEEQGPVMAVALSPQGFPLDYNGILTFYAEVGAWPKPGGVVWNGAWRNDVVAGSDAGDPPNASVANMMAADQFGTIPLNVFGWRSGEEVYLAVPGNATADWTNAEARAHFHSMLVAFAQEHEPPFLFVGNENDFYFKHDPVDYARWVEFYEDAYDAVKAVSPATMMGTVFNFEHLSGTGSLSGFDPPLWGALDAHDLSKIDILGVTLYPFFDNATPADVPDDYLAPLLARIGNKPVAITETGWAAESPSALPWGTGEALQLEYLEKLRTILADVNVQWLTWLFMYEMEDPGGSPFEWAAFASISLKDNDGRARPIHDAWLSF